MHVYFVYPRMTSFPNPVSFRHAASSSTCDFIAVFLAFCTSDPLVFSANQFASPSDQTRRTSSLYFSAPKAATSPILDGIAVLALFSTSFSPLAGLRTRC